MRLSKLRLENWLRFGGTHDLDLGPLVYGVVARWADDPERSNWGGKTALLTAVRFALYGTHPADTEDDWITRGAEQGGVTLVLDTGERVERSRVRGKATRLRLDADGRQLHGEEAQREVVRRVGLADADFGATVYFEQKTFARFVTARPGQRMEIVRAWLDLDPLYGARDRIAADLRALLRDEAALGARMAAEEQRERETFSSVAAHFPALPLGHRLYGVRPEGWRAVLVAQIEAANARAAAAQERVTALARRGEAAQQHQRDAADLARWDAIDRELREAGEVTGYSGESRGLLQLRTTLSAAEVAAAEVSREVRTARTLAAGAFDGACPLLPGFGCPAVREINGRRAEAREALADASARLVAASGEAESALSLVRDAEARETAAERRRGRLEVLQADLARLAEGAERARRRAGAPPEGDASAEQAALRAEQARYSREAYDVARAVGEFDGGDARRAAVSRELAEKRAEVVARQEALAVLALARRTIATDALDAITSRANGLLADAGIGLTLAVSWMREVRGQLAATCDGCGAPFGASQRVKECPGCGAARGPKLAEELELRVSSRSGAADDLAGLVFCLAAGAWLRERRSSGWSAAFLDEPAGALDAMHKRLLSAHLQAMLASRHGFEQAFVVAHEQGFTEGLPGLVVVSAGPEFSSVEIAR